MSEKMKTGTKKKTKEYKDRWTKPLVNPPITQRDYEYEKNREREEKLIKDKDPKGHACGSNFCNSIFRS